MDAAEEEDDELLSSDDEEAESGRGGVNVSKGTPSTNIVVSPWSIKMSDENFAHTSSEERIPHLSWAPDVSYMYQPGFLQSCTLTLTLGAPFVLGGNLDMTVVALASDVVMYAIPMLAVVCVHKKSPRPHLFEHVN